MFCSECGVENVDGGGVCRSCGSALDSAAVPVAAVAEVEAAKTSRVAIAAMVLGILSVFAIPMALPAVICGVVALVKVSKSGGALKGKGFAITGIAVPVVVLVMCAMMVVKVHQVVCSMNIREAGTAMIIYASDHGDEYPAADKWCEVLMAETGVDPKQFKCPKASEGRCNYAMNENVAKFGGSAPGDMVLLFESNKSGLNLSGGTELLTDKDHFGGGINIVFADGHADFVKREDIGSLNWTGEE